MLSFAGLFLCLVFPVVLAKIYSPILVSIGTCPAKGGPETIVYDVTLKGKEDKFLNINAKLPKEFNEKFTYKANVEMFNGFSYVQYLEANGDVCDGIAQLAQVPFERFKSQVKPPLTEACSAPPGEYVLIGYKISEEEVDGIIPTAGNFSSTVNLYDEKGTHVLCAQAKYIIYEHD